MAFSTMVEVFNIFVRPQAGRRKIGPLNPLSGARPPGENRLSPVENDRHKASDAYFALDFCVFLPLNAVLLGTPNGGAASVDRNG